MSGRCALIANGSWPWPMLPISVRVPLSTAWRDGSDIIRSSAMSWMRQATKPAADFHLPASGTDLSLFGPSLNEDLPRSLSHAYIGHRFMCILTLAHTYIAVALCGRRREAMPVYVWGVRVMQIMQVMQYLFSHTRAYILKRRGGKGIMFSYNPLVFLPFGRFPVSANVASNCMRCFWVSSASRLLPRGIDR